MKPADGLPGAQWFRMLSYLIYFIFNKWNIQHDLSCWTFSHVVYLLMLYISFVKNEIYQIGQCNCFTSLSYEHLLISYIIYFLNPPYIFSDMNKFCWHLFDPSSCSYWYWTCTLHLWPFYTQVHWHSSFTCTGYYYLKQEWSFTQKTFFQTYNY